MSETPLFRDGKAILKVRTNPDGSVTLFKPFVIKPAHVMQMTGAPGWDKRYVDQVFEDTAGSLRYVQDGVQYDIDIDTFRAHAFVRDDAGEQYHCPKRHYKTIGVAKVSPLREPERGIALPPLKFGEVIPCPSCHGERKQKPCTRCSGVGYIPWKTSGSSAG